MNTHEHTVYTLMNKYMNKHTIIMKEHTHRAWHLVRRASELLVLSRPFCALHERIARSEPWLCTTRERTSRDECNSRLAHAVSFVHAAFDHCFVRSEPAVSRNSLTRLLVHTPFVHTPFVHTCAMCMAHMCMAHMCMHVPPFAHSCVLPDALSDKSQFPNFQRVLSPKGMTIEGVIEVLKSTLKTTSIAILTETQTTSLFTGSASTLQEYGEQHPVELTVYNREFEGNAEEEDKLAAMRIELENIKSTGIRVWSPNAYSEHTRTVLREARRLGMCEQGYQIVIFSGVFDCILHNKVCEGENGEKVTPPAVHPLCSPTLTHVGSRSRPTRTYYTVCVAPYPTSSRRVQARR